MWRSFHPRGNRYISRQSVVCGRLKLSIALLLPCMERPDMVAEQSKSTAFREHALRAHCKAP